MSISKMAIAVAVGFVTIAGMAAAAPHPTAEVLLRSGVVLSDVGMKTLARYPLRLADWLAPNRLAIVSSRALAASESDRHDEAIYHASRLIGKYPTDLSWPHALIFRAQFSKRDYARAAEIYHQGVMADAKGFSSYMRGYVKRQTFGSLDETAALAKRFAARNSNSPAPYHFLAHVLLVQHDKLWDMHEERNKQSDQRNKLLESIERQLRHLAGQLGTAPKLTSGDKLKKFNDALVAGLKTLQPSMSAEDTASLLYFAKLYFNAVSTVEPGVSVERATHVLNGDAFDDFERRVKDVFVTYTYNLRTALNKVEQPLIAAANAATRNSEGARGYHELRLRVAERLPDAGLIEVAATEALEDHPNDAQFLSQRAMSRRTPGKSDQAFADIESAIAAAPGNSELYYNRAWLHRDRGDERAALADYDTAIRLDPKNTDALRVRADLKIKAGRIDDALVDLNQAVAADPELFWSYFDRGKLLEKLGRIREAIADYRKVLALDPSWTYLNERIKKLASL